MVKIIKTGIVNNPMKKKDLFDHVHKIVEEIAVDWEAAVKTIISDKAVDQGGFLNSIWSEVFDDGKTIGFQGNDGVSYGIFWEKGTKLHWVPFYRYNNINEPVLADWGRRVLHLSQEEMLKMGGIKTSLPALAPFMRSLLLIQDSAPETFKKLETKFEKRMKSQ